MRKSTRPLFSAIGKELIFAFLILCMNLALVQAAAALNGAYLLVRDSDGTVPKKDAVVIITFKGNNTGTLAMSAVQPGETVTDTGAFSVSGEHITIQFKEMEWAATRQRYYTEGCYLILPFKALAGSAGPGTSLWTKNSADCKGKGSPAKDSPIMAQLQTMASNMNNQQKADVSDQKGDNTPLPDQPEAPTEAKESCEDCKWGRCIEQLIEQKKAFIKMYQEIADQYAKLYFAKDKNGNFVHDKKGSLVPLDKIDDPFGPVTLYVRNKKGQLVKVERDDLEIAKNQKEYLDNMEKWMQTRDMLSDDVRKKYQCPACPMGSISGMQIGTNQSDCSIDQKEYEKFKAAVPCREISYIAYAHEAFHRNMCQQRKKDNKLATPYGMSLEEVETHKLEIKKLTELLAKIKKTPNGCWRCGKTKEIFFDAAECNEKCPAVTLGGNLVYKCFKLNEKGEHVMGLDNQF